MKSPRIFPSVVLAVAVLAALTAGCADEPSDDFEPAAYPPEYRGETAQARLLDLQKGLDSALADLQKTPASPQSWLVDGAIAQVKQAQADTGHALEYVQAHPESDPLPLIPARGGVPINGFRSGLLYELEEPDFQSAYPMLVSASNAMAPSILNLIEGPYPGASAIVGDLGGYRDKIIMDVNRVQAQIDAVARIMDRASKPNPPPTPSAATVTIQLMLAGANPAVPPGAISGTAADDDGLAANALVSCRWVEDDGQNQPDKSWLIGSIPMAITDDQGAFTIKDLPPGRYEIFISRAFNRNFIEYGPIRNADEKAAPIEVKAGATTTLSAPIPLQKEY